MVNPMVKICAGIDVHKDMLVVCLMKGELIDDQPTTCIKEFETLPDSLEKLASWLDSEHCEQVAMESTGIYWKPVWTILENHSYKLILANARDIKNKPGRKTDTLDAEWIAGLLRCGLIESSFVPDQDIRELRNSTRLYRKTKQDITRVKNRIHKILEESGIKITHQISDVFGVTGIKILEKIIYDEDITYSFLLQITSTFGANKLRKKIDEIYRGLQRKVSPTNLKLLQLLYNHYKELVSMLNELEDIISKQIMPYSDEEELLCTIPGISKTAARSILAEIGPDMSVFPNDKHLSSWAGICPGNNESAGKKKKGRTTKRGSKALKGTLCESAWSSVNNVQSIFSKIYGAYVRRMGKQKAITAVANKILQVCYVLLRDHVTYQEIEPIQTKAIKQRKLNKMISMLENEGYEIVLKSPEIA